MVGFLGVFFTICESKVYKDDQYQWLQHFPASRWHELSSLKTVVWSPILSAPNFKGKKDQGVFQGKLIMLTFWGEKKKVFKVFKYLRASCGWEYIASLYFTTNMRQGLQSLEHSLQMVCTICHNLYSTCWLSVTHGLLRRFWICL